MTLYYKNLLAARPLEVAYNVAKAYSEMLLSTSAKDYKSQSYIYELMKQPKYYQEQTSIRWYDSLRNGSEPDYSFYGDRDYIADLWYCWKVYSRQYLRLIQKARNRLKLSNIKIIVDLGNGLGLTTSALSQIFPDATVYGINIKGTYQYYFAKRLASLYGWFLCSSVDEISASSRSLVFASEYFEHFPRPIMHLEEILDSLVNVSHLVIANAFTGDSPGHFPVYEIHIPLSDQLISIPKEKIGYMFYEYLRSRNYFSIRTGFYNSRPRVLVRQENKEYEEGLLL